MSDSATTSYIDACLSGLAFADDIDDWVDRWHDAAGIVDGLPVTLASFLGMSHDEYGLWVEQPSALRFIVASHQKGTPVSKLMTSQEQYALAARSEDPDATSRVLYWLVETGRIDPESASRA